MAVIVDTAVSKRLFVAAKKGTKGLIIVQLGKMAKKWSLRPHLDSRRHSRHGSNRIKVG